MISVRTKIACINHKKKSGNVPLLLTNTYYYDKFKHSINYH